MIVKVCLVKRIPPAGDPQNCVGARPASSMEPQVGVIGHFVCQLIILYIVASHKHLHKLWSYTLTESTHSKMQVSSTNKTAILKTGLALHLPQIPYTVLLT